MRITPLRKDELVGEQADLYEALVGKSLGRAESFALNERGETRGPFAVLLHHPASGRPLQQLAATLRFAGLLPDLAREAAILVVAAHWNDEHEWSSHALIASKLGMTDTQLDTLRSGAEVTFEDPIAQATFDAAYAIVKRSDLTDEEYARVAEYLSEEQLVELTVVIGYYWLLSLQLRVFRVPAGR